MGALGLQNAAGVTWAWPRLAAGWALAVLHALQILNKLPDASGHFKIMNVLDRARKKS